MQFSFDRMGDLVIVVPQFGLDVQFLPVTKVQYERFLADRSLHGDLWYEELLAVNPRVALQQAMPENREGLLLTGIFPKEAQEYAHWLGADWHLPTATQWRNIYCCLLDTAFRAQDIPDSVREGMNRRTIALLDAILQQTAPQTLAVATLMSGGVLEWVHDPPHWGGLGSPRPTFSPNLFNPLLGPPAIPADGEVRTKGLGFRLVRPTSR